MLNITDKTYKKSERLRNIGVMIKDHNRDEMCLSRFIINRDEKYLVDFHTFNNDNDYLDLRRLFFDSSIWFRYAENTDAELLLNEECKILEQFYSLNSALEFRDFQIRIFENSYLPEGKAKSSNGHSVNVTPFLFHSETFLSSQTSKKICELYDQLNSLTVKDKQSNGLKSVEWHWNILLADDEVTKSDVNFCKLNAIKTVLCLLPYVKSSISISTSFDENNIFINLNNHVKLVFHLDAKTKFIDAQHSIIYDNSKDFIMLDYLFRSKSIENIIDDSINYGDEIIIQLADDKNEDRKKWILPISAYNFAFLESINSKGLPFYDENYVLSTGGDPICTPHLFRFKFFEMLHLQLSELLLDKAKPRTLEKIFNELKNCKEHKSIVDVSKTMLTYVLKLGLKFREIHKIDSGFCKSAINNVYGGISNEEQWNLIEKFFILMAGGMISSFYEMEDIIERGNFSTSIKINLTAILKIFVSNGS